MALAAAGLRPMTVYIRARGLLRLSQQPLGIYLIHDRVCPERVSCPCQRESCLTSS